MWVASDKLTSSPNRGGEDGTLGLESATPVTITVSTSGSSGRSVEKLCPSIYLLKTLSSSFSS
jgi:hypothetical protein